MVDDFLGLISLITFKISDKEACSNENLFDCLFFFNEVDARKVIVHFYASINWINNKIKVNF